MTKIFKTPFAETGDKISPPDAVQPDGSVSYALGYGFDYQRDTSLDGGVPVDPLAKVFPREQHNGILNDITAALGEIQSNGLTIWQSIGGPYPVNALVRYSGLNWRSTVANNATTPGAAGASWVDASFQPSATEIISGIIRLATQPEVNAGDDDKTAITPKKLAEKIKQATETVAGISRMSSLALALAGSDEATAMTPLRVKQALDQKLPFVPVQQGGAAGQGLNKLNIGWDALSRLRLSVDGLNQGAFVLDSNLTAFLPKRAFTTKDYIRIPDVPGGLIIQWTEGVSVSLSPGAIASQSVSLPITFPTSVLKTFVTTKYISGVTTVASEAPSGGTESSVSVVMHNPVPTGTGTGRPVVLSFGY